MESVLHNNDNSRRLVGGWMLLALSAFAISTLCAVLLVGARAPLPEAFAGFANFGALFGRALVVHVGFAVVIWFLACAAGIWTLAAGGPASPWQWGALALASTGLVAMPASLFSSTAHPVLANYVPVLDHPVFLAGLSLFVLGVVLSATATVCSVFRRAVATDAPVWSLSALLSIAAAAMAFVALLISLLEIGLPAAPGAFEELVWGPGHVLQFVHVLLLMGIWIFLGEHVTGTPVASRGALRWLLLLGAAPLLVAPFIYLRYPVGTSGFRHGFTMLMTWGCWPAAALLGLQILRRLWQTGRTALTVPPAQALCASIFLFLLGCVLGAMIHGDSTMVPAHYHGTVGAVTLAYMALGYRMLSAFGMRLAHDRRVSRQQLLYGAGLAILALALAWSGWLGVPRKTPHADVMVQYPAYITAMVFAGFGGMLAVSGAALFIFNMIGCLRTMPQKPEVAAGRRDVRLKAVVLTLVMTVLIGMLFAFWPGDPNGRIAADVGSTVAHVAQEREKEITQRFAEGVERLRSREYEASANALHRVLQLAPEMPEAHVNMGFALIGLGKHAMARDFFEAAISLRTTQMNAYYGLGIALAETGDVAGALGAMRTYVHRAKADDPYLRKANAAVWEWESQLEKVRLAKVNSSTSIPKTENAAVRYPIGEKKLQ